MHVNVDGEHLVTMPCPGRYDNQDGAALSHGFASGAGLARLRVTVSDFRPLFPLAIK